MQRRSFLSTATAALAAGVLPRRVTAGPRRAAAANVGIQFYTVRRPMAQDAAGTLTALARIGYREVELHALYGKTAAEFRKLLNDHGLVAPATHVGIGEVRNNLGKLMDDADTLGHKWIIVPSLNAPDRTADGLKRVAESLNEAGAQGKARGFRFGYHNHGFEFAPIADGKNALDILLQNSDPTLVDFELDLFWARQGGGDALAYFRQYAGRFFAVHVKDMAADGKMVNVGQGVMDFAALFAQGERAGVKHYFVEHDQPTDPINDARVSYAAVQKLLK